MTNDPQFTDPETQEAAKIAVYGGTMKEQLRRALEERGFTRIELTDVERGVRPDGRCSIAGTAVLNVGRDLSRAGKLSLLRRLMRDMPFRVETDASLLYDDRPGQAIAYVYILSEGDGTFRRTDA